MSVTIHQAKKYTDSVHIVSADPNKPDLDFTYELEPEKIIGAAQRGIVALENAQNMAAASPGNHQTLEAYGEAVLSLFNLFFGAANTEKMVVFYDGRYADMLADFIPAITGDIMPKLREASRSKAARIASAAQVMKR